MFSTSRDPHRSAADLGNDEYNYGDNDSGAFDPRDRNEGDQTELAK